MKNLFRNISIYSLGDLLHKSVQFLLLPLYTNVLSPGLFGQLELIYMLGSLLVIFNGLLIQNAYTRFYFDSKDSHFKKKVFGTSLVFICISSCLGLFVCLIYSSYFSKLIFGSIQYVEYIRLICISTALGSICALFNKNLIFRNFSITFVSINLIETILTISFTIFFVLYVQNGITGILYSQIIGRLIRLLLLIVLSSSHISLSFSSKILRNMLYFSIFMIPSEISSFIAYMSNRFFINDYQGLTQVGIFSLGYKIASITPLLINGPVKTAFKPYMFSLINNKKKLKVQFSSFLRYYFVFCLSFIFILSIFSKELITMMAHDSYFDSYKVIFPLSIGYLLIGLSGLINTSLAISKKTWVFGLAWALAALVNIILNIYLIPDFGLIGASIATVGGFLTVLVIFIYYTQKYFPIKIEYIKFISLLFFTIFLYYFVDNLIFHRIFFN